MLKKILRIAGRHLLESFLYSLPLTVYLLYLGPFFDQNGGADCLKDSRKFSNHTDYLWGYLKGIPWSETVFCRIDPPTQIAGNQRYHLYGNPKPIPRPGQWQVSHVRVKTHLWDVHLFYVAHTAKNRWHSRIGWRWDDNDNIFFPTLASKRIGIDWELLLWEKTFG